MSVLRNRAAAGELIAVLLLASCASGPQPRQTAIPEKLRVPENQTRLLRAAARGAQIYTCKEKTAEPATYEWVLKAPEADLFDEHGAKIGRHFAGPSWETSDGTRVVGEAIERSPVQGAIPWLLLRAKSHEGSGVLANAAYVQRIDTAGGVAPQTGCDAAHAGAEVRVDYSANYDFYGPVAPSAMSSAPSETISISSGS